MLQILLVDDEPYVVDDLSITIPWENIDIEQVHVAYSGMEALDILQKHPIDIVVTDINMPQMSGLELIETIKKNWKHMKCVLLTGYAEFEYARIAINQNVSDYLLKPVTDDHLIESLLKIKQEIQQDWEQLASYQRTMQTLREHLPLLRDKFLNDLLQGRRISDAQFIEKAKKFNLPFAIGDTTALLVVRLEEFFQKQDMDSLLLLEYAIVNIVGEMLQEHFHVWSCKDSHDYLIFLLSPKSNAALGTEDRFMRNIAYQIQKNVNTIIGGEISIVTTDWGPIPSKTRSLYQSAITTIHQRIGPEMGVYLSSARAEENPSTIPTLQALYEPPTLFHLFETNNWDAIEMKLTTIIQELRSTELSQEHIQETKSFLEASFLYFSHRNSKFLGDIVTSSLMETRSIRTPDQLCEWANTILTQLKSYFDTERLDRRSLIIGQVQDFIGANLHYVSLHSIAEHVGLHPVYLSKIFKAETGQRISDFIFYAKMEKASYLLTNTSLKIYEISEQLGYSNAHYFIKLFKEYSQFTPQEFRDRRRT